MVQEKIEVINGIYLTFGKVWEKDNFKRLYAKVVLDDKCGLSRNKSSRVETEIKAYIDLHTYKAYVHGFKRDDARALRDVEAVIKEAMENLAIELKNKSENIVEKVGI